MRLLSRQPRMGGIILHLSSLPGRFGIGDLGTQAHRFVDFLAASGQQLWQVLPVGPTSLRDWCSPYSSFSAFAGNPLLLCLEQLQAQGLLDASALEGVPAFPEERVDFPRVVEFKERLLAQASRAFRTRASPALREEFARFQEASRAWLEDYALFTALREEQGVAWSQWEEGLRRREPAALEAAKLRLADAVFHHQYLQFEFDRQWNRLRRYANERGVRIFGDLPIYVSHDSADVWARPEYFRLTPDTLRPSVEAGVPPDFFSEEGQHWGNPVYDWQRLARDDYRWWAERLQQSFRRFDFVRIDHFRAFEAYWVIPAGAPSPKLGRWEKGPGAHFFESMCRQLGELPITVEDVGVITPEVHALREECGFPSMFILQFAFDGNPDNAYLPFKCQPGFIMYTGTHDTSTLLGWFRSLTVPVGQSVLEYLGTTGPRGVHWDLMRVAWSSVAQWALAPLQDVLGLGEEGRMNRPGTVGPENWSWRLRWELLTDELSEQLESLTRTYGRAPEVGQQHRDKSAA
ncbi:4-alpha-glucanotransferase [Vitiosangium sp. GDMCC 1.1324]|nr:4-alpha-glucanotransferase [Vitiosangium sp. GDMCC 1.1324]